MFQTMKQKLYHPAAMSRVCPVSCGQAWAIPHGGISGEACRPFINTLLASFLGVMAPLEGLRRNKMRSDLFISVPVWTGPRTMAIVVRQRHWAIRSLPMCMCPCPCACASASVRDWGHCLCVILKIPLV